VKKARDAKIRGMKEELKKMIKTPLIGRGVSAKFITSGSRPIISDLLAGERKSFSHHQLPTGFQLIARFSE
jgi:ATP-dependent RNA helicase DDX24/MAK5